MKTTRLLRSVGLAGCAWAVLSCSDPTPLGVGPETPPPPSGSLLGWGWGQLTGLLECSPLPADSVTQVVGPEGGVILIGPHRLSVPAGALTEPVAITAVQRSETVNRVSFQPDGLVFATPASLRMSYANCSLLGNLLPKRIAHVSDGLEILDYLLSVDSVWSQTVRGRVDHFSDYAVAW